MRYRSETALRRKTVGFVVRYVVARVEEVLRYDVVLSGRKGVNVRFGNDFGGERTAFGRVDRRGGKIGKDAGIVDERRDFKRAIAEFRRV